MARRNEEKEGLLKKRRRKQAERMVSGEGDPLDPVLALNTIMGVVGFIALIGHFMSILYGLIPGFSIPSLLWAATWSVLFIGIGVTVFWATERSGKHVQASGHKPMPYNEEFVDWTEVSHEDDEGYKLTEEVEAIRSHGVMNWWKSHGGKTKPYIVSIVPNSQKRFSPDGEELGSDWMTPISRYLELETQVLKEIEECQRRLLTFNEEGKVILFEDIDQFDEDGKPKLYGAVWKHEFFPQHIAVMKMRGLIPKRSQAPGKAGTHWGTNYQIHADHGRVPWAKLKSEVKELLSRDKPYCIPGVSWALVAETYYPYIGPIPDYRPADFRIKVESAQRRQGELEGDIEIQSEIQSATLREIQSGRMPIQMIPMPSKKDEEEK